MDKLYRRNQILDLLSSGTIATQLELRRKLGQRGIRVTQATVSRDIEELGIIKTREGYRLPDAAVPSTAPPTLALILKEFLRETRHAANLVILRTHPGNAHTVASALDTARWPEIVGTVAGDDTIFVATGGTRQAARVRNKIQEALEG